MSKFQDYRPTVRLINAKIPCFQQFQGTAPCIRFNKELKIQARPGPVSTEWADWFSFRHCFLH